MVGMMIYYRKRLAFLRQSEDVSRPKGGKYGNL